jgi:lysophospholipase L1-like esterase
MRFFLFIVSVLFAVESFALSLKADSTNAIIYNVIFLGDSITEGGSFQKQGKPTTPTLCGEELGRLLQVEVYISNQGRSGHTTVDFRSANGEKSDLALAKAAAKDLQMTHPGHLIFSIMLGANDSATKGPNGAPVSAANYEINLRRTIDDLLNAFPTAKIVVHNPLWYSPNTQNFSDYGEAGQKRLLTYPPAIANLVRSYAATTPGHVFQGDEKAYKYFEKNYLSDLSPQPGPRGTFYLHPNEYGARHLAQFWARAIIPAANASLHDQ